jgi:hypothetical protein
LNEALNEVILCGAAVATSVMLFTLPIYYVWKLVASFRRQGIAHWPPAVCLGLWLLQRPFFLVSAAGCLQYEKLVADSEIKPEDLEREREKNAKETDLIFAAALNATYQLSLSAH